MMKKPLVTIEYCCQCQWLLRAAWLAQELLNTFAEDLAGVTLKPTHGGRFYIYADDVLLWERKRDGGFPEAKILKQRLRNYFQPDRDLGHIDS